MSCMILDEILSQEIILTKDTVSAIDKIWIWTVY